MHFNANEIVKGPLACSKIQSHQMEIFNTLSKEQFNAAFYLKICKSSIVFAGSTSFRETLIKQIIPNKIRTFNATNDTSIDDLIGRISFKKNKHLSDKFKHGEIFDILFEYRSNNLSTAELVTILDLNSSDSIIKIKEILDNMDEGKLKPYFQYLLDIVEHENE